MGVSIIALAFTFKAQVKFAQAIYQFSNKQQMSRSFCIDCSIDFSFDTSIVIRHKGDSKGNSNFDIPDLISW